MIVDKLINDSREMEEIQTIKERCQDFLEEAKGMALFKNLSKTYADFQKVKVRFKHEPDPYDLVFNTAFNDEIPNIRQRAIFTNGKTSFEPCCDDDLEPFYIFPIDGYKYIYSLEIENSSEDYKQVFDLLFEEFGDEKGKDLITEMLKFTYTSNNLSFGIQKGSEIILYGIPFYYAIRVSSIDSYYGITRSFNNEL